MAKEKIDIKKLTSGESNDNETLSDAVKEIVDALNQLVDVKKLRDGIFTNFITGLVLGFLILLTFILIAACVYIFIIIYCGGTENLKTLLSQIGRIIISFGGWITASILAIKQKK